MDWAEIENIVSSSNEEFDHDYWLEQLQKIDLSSIKEEKRISQAFKLLLLITNVKKSNNESLAEVIEEYDQQLTSKDKLIVSLRTQIKHQDSIGALPESEAIVRSRLRDVEKELEELQIEHSMLSRNYENLLVSESAAQAKAESSSKEAKELEGRNRQLLEDLREYKHQVTYQRETILAKGLGTGEADERSKNFKEKLIDSLHENSALIQVNTKLKEATDQAKEELERGKEEMSKCMEENQKLRGVLKYSDNIIEELRKENISLKNQTNELKGVLRNDDDVNDQVMVMVSQKVKEWGELIEEKDMEISKLRMKNSQIERESNLLKLDMDKNTVSNLSKALEEKELQVINLQEELEKAAGEIEQEIENFELIKSKISSSDSLSKAAKLEKDLSDAQIKLNKTQENLEMSESRVMELEMKLEDCVSRGHRIERGIYGISEAIAEINDLRGQNQKLDKHLKDTLLLLSKMEFRVDQLLDENEFYREKLSLPMVEKELDKFMTAKRFQHEEFKASLVILQNEIRSLENERDELKQHIRNLGKLIAQKLGKDSELEISREFDRELRHNGGPRYSSIVTEIANLNNIVSELSNTRELKDEIREQNKVIKAKNKKLTNLLSQLSSQIKDHCPEHHLLNTIRTALNDQVCAPQIEKQHKITSRLSVPFTNQLKLTYIEDSSNFGAEFVVSMEEYLVESLKQNAILESNLQQATTKFTHINSDYAILKERLALVYEDFRKKNNDWRTEREKLNSKIQSLEGKRSEDEAAILEYENFVNSVEKGDGDEIKRNLAHLTRKIVFLTVNEKSLINRYAMISEANSEAEQEIAKLQDLIRSTEIEHNERILYLEEARDKAAFKIKYLIKRLEDSVSKSVYNKVFEENVTLKQKYNNLLEVNSTNSIERDKIDGLRIEVKRLKTQNLKLEEECSVANSKLNCRENIDGGEGEHHLKTQIKFCKMKEVEDQQRISYGKKMQNELKKSLEIAESRNFQLEENVVKLRDANLRLQTSETNMVVKIADSVSKGEYDKVLQNLQNVEKERLSVKSEMKRLKESSDVLTGQLGVLKIQNENLREEMKILKEHIFDFESQQPEKEVLGKLYRRIIKHSIGENSANQSVVNIKQKIKKIETENLKILKFFDSCDNNCFCHQVESAERIRELQSIISNIRSNYAGCVPFIIHEKSSLLLQNLFGEKEKLKTDIEKLFADHSTVLEELDKAKLERANVQTLSVEEKFRDYEIVKLENMRRKRRIDHLEVQNQNILKDFSSKEQILREIEEENARLVKDSLLQKHSAENYEVVLKKFFDYEHPCLKDFSWGSGEVPQSTTLKSADLAERDQTIKEMEWKLRERENLLENAEREVISRDELISQLRIKLLEVELPLSEGIQVEELKNSLSATQLNVESHEKCLEARDETISNLRNLLGESEKLSNQRQRNYEESVRKLNMALSQQRLLDADESLRDRGSDMRDDHLERTVSYQKEIITSLNTKLNEAKNRIDKLTTNSKSQIRERESEVAELQKKRSADMKKVKGILQKVKIDVKNKNDLIAKLKATQEGNSAKEMSYKKEIEDLNAQITHKNQENLDYTKTISDLKETINSGKPSTKKSTNFRETEELRERLKTASRQLANVKKQNREIEEAKDAVTKEKNDYMEAISNLNTKLYKLKRENESFRAKTSRTDASTAADLGDPQKPEGDTMREDPPERESKWNSMSQDEKRIKIIRLEHDNEMLRSRIRDLEGNRHMLTNR